MGKIVIKKNADNGASFVLKANNGEIIANGEIYSTMNACRKGIASLMRNALLARLEDQTEEGFAVLANPKFELYMDKAGEFRFRLKARNGKNIAASEGYKSKSSCLNGIESVRNNAPEAEVVMAKE